MARRLHLSLDWCGDFLRLCAGLFYWNYRKTRFIWRGRQERNPCQNPGDGDESGQIRCDACTHWAKPTRFRRLCPLLIRHDNEWRCGAARNQIQSFWGRAALTAGGLVAAGYLGAALLVFAILQVSGAHSLGWLDVAWPGRWDRISQARARYFFAETIKAFAAGDHLQAQINLASARTVDPKNYDAMLLQAQLGMYQHSRQFSDQLFRQLLLDHPAERVRTALAYHDTLLALFRFDAVGELALAMCQSDPARTALWCRSLLQALRASGQAAAFVAANPDALARLPAHARLLLQADALRQGGRPDEARRLLARPFDGPLNAIYMQEQVSMLALLPAHDAAQLLLHRYSQALGEFEFLLAQLELDLADRQGLQTEVDLAQILHQPLTPARVERVAAVLLRHEAGNLYLTLHGHLLQHPDLAAGVSGAALWISGLGCRAETAAQHWRTAGRQMPGDSYPSITRINFAARRLDQIDGVPHLMNMLTLPREIITVLQARAVATPVNR